MKKFYSKHKVKIQVGLLSFALLLMAMPVGAETADTPDEALITQLIGVVTDAIEIFLSPPLVWFVVLGLVGASIGIVKGLIPRKRTK